MSAPDRSNERKNANKGGKKVSISEESSSKETAREIQGKIEREINEGISNLLRRLQELQALQTAQTAEHGDELGVRVVSLAGNNSGATMNLGSQFRNEAHERGFHVHRQSTERANGMQHATVNIYVNSNVQGVNNSILYNSSCTIRDPGVHLDVHPIPRSSGNPSKQPSVETADDASTETASDLKSSVSATSDIRFESKKSSADASVARTLLRSTVSEPSGNEPRHQTSESVSGRPRRRGFSLAACFRITGGAKSDASE